MRAVLVMCATVLLGLLSGACSTIVSGTDQTISVASDPAGATCELKRGDEVVGYIESTPGSVSVSKSKDTIVVTCEREEHLPGSAALDSEFQAMTAGNLLFGGIIGVAIDASSGAMNQYPSSINVILPPETFESAEARDLYFDGRIAAVEQQHADAQAAARESALCKKDPEHADCIDVLNEIDRIRTDEMARLDEQRAMAKVE